MNKRYLRQERDEIFCTSIGPAAEIIVNVRCQIHRTRRRPEFIFSGAVCRRCLRRHRLDQGPSGCLVGGGWICRAACLGHHLIVSGISKVRLCVARRRAVAYITVSLVNSEHKFFCHSGQSRVGGPLRAIQRMRCRPAQLLLIGAPQGRPGVVCV